jgi:hypothetical protein
VLTVAEEFVMVGDDCAPVLLVAPNAEKVTLLLLAMGNRYGEGDDWDQLLVQKQCWSHCCTVAKRIYTPLLGSKKGNHAAAAPTMMMKLYYYCDRGQPTLLLLLRGVVELGLRGKTAGRRR